MPLDEYVDDGVSLGYDLPHRGPTLENQKIEQPEEKSEKCSDDFNGVAEGSDDINDLNFKEEILNNDEYIPDIDLEVEQSVNNVKGIKYLLNQSGLHEAASNGH